MKVDWQKTASILFCILAAVLTFFLVGRYVIAIVMPFLIAWGIALAIHPAASAIASRTRLPRKLSVVLLLLLFFSLLAALLFIGINRLMGEVGRLAEHLTTDDQFSRLMERLDRFGKQLPFLDGQSQLQNRWDEMISTLLREVVSTATSAVTSFATELFRSMPSIILFITVTVIASFYFALDLEGVHHSLASLLPRPASKRLPAVKQRTRRFVIRYLRVYLLLMLITFCELFVGFSLLRVEYSFLLALLVSVIDILPVLGVGTILVPWSIIELLSRDFRMGFGLLALWGIITVVRQVSEPRIVGETIGLHPLLTLVGMYVGFRIFGIVGMLLAPALIIAVRTGWREWMPHKKME